MKSILILCTGNSCRSQMAEGFIKSLNENLQVFSAGTIPAERVHPKAIEIMQEIGIDISKNQPKNVSLFKNTSFDFVITVCGEAEKTCPTFNGNVENRLHIEFEDPAKATGTEEEIKSFFRKIREEIRTEFLKFYKKYIKIQKTKFQKVIYEQPGLIGRELYTSNQFELVHLTLNSNKKMESHSMPIKVIFFVIEGEIIININKQEFLLKKNSFIEVNPGEERFAYNKSSKPSQIMVIKHQN